MALVSTGIPWALGLRKDSGVWGQKGKAERAGPMGHWSTVGFGLGGVEVRFPNSCVGRVGGGGLSPPRLLKAKGGLFPGIQLQDAARGERSPPKARGHECVSVPTLWELTVRCPLWCASCTWLLAALPPPAARGAEGQERWEDARATPGSCQERRGMVALATCQGRSQAGPLPASSGWRLDGPEDSDLRWHDCDPRALTKVGGDGAGKT